ncbi:tol-pal system protein YbgF [Amylibacter sp. SFDW26]|uniref:tol-pal system protein YbgF n=1 Tax=Amylibacter sp. SFDW26 TaxID=2652722 RepID=UPI0012629EEF|nr:tol-pal system protein YbgF [Amylibacter sp. SFDW26]KAB7613460.1 tol-pal system protein YbgF [Amylibacter sp. SFDW26]
MFIGRKFVKATSLCIWAACTPVLLHAQSNEETLADIRQELTFLNIEIQRLNQELSTSSASDTSATSSGSLLQRTDALEQELRRITGVVENLQFRIEKIVQDGTNRIGDLEFRLVELEGGDVTALGQTSTLGGLELTAPTQPITQDNSIELTASEQGDFDRAKSAVEAGKFAEAVTEFDQFLLTYPNGPLTSDAHYWRAEGLAGQGDWSNAARAFLESFSGTPDAAIAPKSLYRLGVSLAQLGQTQDACATLGEVERRYPAAVEVGDAQAEMTALSCS